MLDESKSSLKAKRVMGESKVVVDAKADGSLHRAAPPPHEPHCAHCPHCLRGLVRAAPFPPPPAEPRLYARRCKS
jgi:hypothetical protein